MVEIICKYEGLILGTLYYLEDKHRLEQYKVHKNRLKEHTLQNLYMRYKAIQSTNANIEDKLILDLADKAVKEMVAAAELVEEVIKTLPSQGGANS